MTYSPEFFLYKEISTGFCFALIFLLSFVVGAYCLWQSSKLKAIQEQLPIYISIEEIINNSSGE